MDLEEFKIMNIREITAINQEKFGKIFAFIDFAITALDSSKAILFSTPGEKTEVVISGKDTFLEMVGRGGGNFEMILPRDFVLESGTSVHLPGVSSYIVARAETIISDPRDAFLKALLVSPVNIQELKFVEIEK